MPAHARTHAHTHTPDSMQVSDHNGNLLPQLALIKLVLHQLKWETLVEDTVDASSATQLSSVDNSGPPFNPPLKLITKPLNHAVEVSREGQGTGERERVEGNDTTLYGNKEPYPPRQLALPFKICYQ